MLVHYKLFTVYFVSYTYDERLLANLPYRLYNWCLLYIVFCFFVFFYHSLVNKVAQYAYLLNVVLCLCENVRMLMWMTDLSVFFSSLSLRDEQSCSFVRICDSWDLLNTFIRPQCQSIGDTRECQSHGRHSHTVYAVGTCLARAASTALCPCQSLLGLARRRRRHQHRYIGLATAEYQSSPGVRRPLNGATRNALHHQRHSGSLVKIRHAPLCCGRTGVPTFAPRTSLLPDHGRGLEL